MLWGSGILILILWFFFQVPAQKATEAGLFNECVPPQDIDSKVEEWVSWPCAQCFGICWICFFDRLFSSFLTETKNYLCHFRVVAIVSICHCNQSIDLFLNGSINPSIHQSVNPSIHQSINQSINQSIQDSICLSNLAIYPSTVSICGISIYLSIYLSIYQQAINYAIIIYYV